VINILIVRRIFVILKEFFPVGPLQCNCILIACDETNEAIVIDPGDDAEKILDIAKSLDVQIKKILHTHAHFDHIGATKAIHEATNAIRYLHESDLFMYQNVAMQGSLFGITVEDPGEVEEFLQDQQEISFGNCSCQTIHTPGHSPGSCCFMFKEAKLLSSGDTLFQQSIGRTDLWGGDLEQLKSSIREKLYCLPEDTLVIPGHGPTTEISFEKINNSFVPEKDVF